jgi:hypothetical protein
MNNSTCGGVEMPSILTKIKTPVWTGDIDQKSELLQPTGICGISMSKRQSALLLP